jgi:hypothetical protein
LFVSNLIEYPGRRHPSTSRIRFPIRYPILSCPSLNAIGTNGHSS